MQWSWGSRRLAAAALAELDGRGRLRGCVCMFLLKPGMRLLSVRPAVPSACQPGAPNTVP